MDLMWIQKQPEKEVNGFNGSEVVCQNDKVLTLFDPRMAPLFRAVVARGTEKG